MVAFRVTLGQGGQPSWWLCGVNDELLAWAGRYYVSLAFARNEAAAFQSAALRAEYQIYPHPAGGWGWRAVQPVDYFMAYSAGCFNKPAEARRAARDVKTVAHRASGL
ncbi:hypothetical protein QF038_001678 [Pseudarthrobacter sp. W1I19]|nr:hypothetical protein [Pseudarthrobacter sp. W1I19]